MLRVARCGARKNGFDSPQELRGVKGEQGKAARQGFERGKIYGSLLMCFTPWNS